jgi:hypothetical protein
MDILNYIPVIISLRSQKFTPFKANNPVVNNDKKEVHKAVLRRLNQEDYPVAMIYENELTLSRSLEDVSNNEIKAFVTQNQDWDILILSACNLPSSLVDGYSRIEKVSTSQGFEYDFENIYIVSKRFMQKVQNNDLSNIELYLYNSPFLTYPKMGPEVSTFVMGKTENINEVSMRKISYTWKEW